MPAQEVSPCCGGNDTRIHTRLVGIGGGAGGGGGRNGFISACKGSVQVPEKGMLASETHLENTLLVVWREALWLRALTSLGHL